MSTTEDRAVSASDVQRVYMETDANAAVAYVLLLGRYGAGGRIVFMSNLPLLSRRLGMPTRPLKRALLDLYEAGFLSSDGTHTFLR